VRIQRIQFLEKYAARAEDLLSQKYGDKYTSEDVEKLAEALINMDVKRAAEFERVEEIIKKARYTAKGFAEEINTNLGDEAFKKLASVALLGSLKNILKGASKSNLGQKIMGGLKQTGQRARELIKKDPLMAAGISAGSLAAGVAGSAFLTDNE
jgi:hypothetical protein